MTKFALRVKKSQKFLVADVSATGDAEFCGDTETTLYEDENGTPWMVDTVDHAEWVAQHATPWYNSDSQTPNHTFKREELEVVPLTIQVHLPVSCRLPTPKDAARLKYAESQPRHYQFLCRQLDAGVEFPLSLYDLQEFIRTQKWPEA